MSQADMSRRVGVLMGTKTVQRMSNDNRQAFMRAVTQASTIEDLEAQFMGVIMDAEKELTDRGYVRDSKGRLLPPESVAEQTGAATKEKRIIVQVKKP